MKISGRDGVGAGVAPKRIAAALEMNSSQGQVNIFSRFEGEERDFDEGLEFPEARAEARNNEEVFERWAKERFIDADSMKKRVQRRRKKN